ncbi:MAG: hypothetical protein NTY83_01790 [Candidatus Micrarchaeota archaeon]|nr:hypothetical protein [Candidatus Micrarchaeota archaeon]
MSNAHNYKGFFFVLVSFILLSYILVSTYAWVRAIETSERTYSDAFRASTLTTLADQVSEQRMNQYADISSHYTMYKLVGHSVQYPLQDEEDDEYYHIRAAFFELLSNCTTAPEHFVDRVPAAYSETEKDTYCFAGFLGSLNTSLATSGFEVQEFSISNLSLNETMQPLELEMNMTLYLRIKDLQSNTSIDRTYHISRIVNVTGYKDPLLERESISKLRATPTSNLTIRKGMYLYPSWETDADIPLEDAHTLFYPIKRGQGSEGQGWFYGDLVLWNEAGNVAYPSQSILVGNFSDIESGVPNRDDFGAYILLNDPETSSNSCGATQYGTFNAIHQDDRSAPGSSCPEPRLTNEIEKPFMVYADEEDFMDDIYTESNGPDAFPHSILFISQYSYEEISSNPELKYDSDPAVFDIENLRDFTRCSYYIVNANNSPSFLQRLLSDGYKRTSPIGLETLLVGKWAGGVDTPDWNDYSRVDREFFGKKEGEKIRGMPGCKDWFMCADDPMISDVGNFRFYSPDSMEFYLGTSDDTDEEYIGCDDGRASCENP